MSIFYWSEDRPFPSIMHIKRGEEIRRYVPERTCRNEATAPSVLFECSECGACFVQEPIDGCFDYCPNCGARVTGRES